MAAGDVKLTHGASANFTLTLGNGSTGLASSATRVAGRESTAIATGTPVVDYLIGGKVTTGTSPTANTQIDIWVYAAVNDTPTYPDSFTGSDSDRSATSENVRNAALRLAASVRVDSTSDRTYWVRPFSLAELFGGVLPTDWGLWVVHDTATPLNVTAANHSFSYTPVYYQVEQ